MILSALNVDFNSPGLDLLRSTRLTYAGINTGTFLKSGIFAIGLFSMKTVTLQIGTDMLLIIISIGDVLFNGINIVDLQ